MARVNNGIRRLMRRRKRARAKSKKTGKVTDWNRYKGMDKDLKKQLREAQTEYLTNIFVDDDDRLSKKASKAYFKSRRKENIGIPPLIDSNGRSCKEAPEDKAQILCEQYTSVFTKYDGRAPVPTVPYNLPSMPRVTIDANGVQKLLTEVKINKANGPDLIPNTVLKECNRELAPILTDIFRKSLRDGRLPKDWLNANVVGIYKKGPKQEARNYRPISLTSVTCKILEHIIFSQIIDAALHSSLLHCRNPARIPERTKLRHTTSDNHRTTTERNGPNTPARYHITRPPKGIWIRCPTAIFSISWKPVESEEMNTNDIEHI